MPLNYAVQMIRAKNFMKRLANNAGYSISKDKNFYPVEISDAERQLLDDVIHAKISMVSREGLINTLLAVKYVIDREIPGDFVECGVWRGGNAILASKMFSLSGVEKKVHLFDTFLGTTKPDILKDGMTPFKDFQNAQRNGFNEIAFATMEEVKSNFMRFNISEDLVRYVQGDVLVTLDQQQYLPDQISVLRLDTDWFYSTKKELEILYPLLSVGGCLIIDDYGYSDGSRLATDSYFDIVAKRPFFHYTNANIRTCIKF